MKIVLIGFMGSGKSVVGRQLAKKLGWVFFDTDEMIEKQVGHSVADIIRAKGEPAFREVERKIVQLVSLSDACVISTGGGVPLNPDNWNDLAKNGEIVWLKLSPESALKRVGNLKSRPLIDPNDPLGSIKNKMEERIPAYAKASHLIETDKMSVPEIVDKILSMIPSLSR